MAKRVALIGLGVVLGLGISEAIARRYFRGITERVAFQARDVYYYKDAFGVRHHLPGKVGSDRSWDGRGRVEIRINALGFRGPELLVPKPENTFRLLFVGDSVTLSGCTREEDTFVHLVKRDLIFLGSKQMEAVNGGVGDVGLREEIQLVHQSLEIEPSAGVLVWYLNDARPPQGFPDELLFQDPILSWIGRSAWAHRSLLVRLAYEMRRNKLIKQGVAGSEGLNQRFKWVDPYNEFRKKNNPQMPEFLRLIEMARFDWGDAWNRSSMEWTLSEIETLNRELKEKGVPLLVVATPVEIQVAWRGDDSIVRRPQMALRLALAQMGIPFLDLIDPLRKESGGLFFDQCHYTPRGNAAVARAIAAFIEQWYKSR